MDEIKVLKAFHYYCFVSVFVIFRIEGILSESSRRLVLIRPKNSL